MSVKNTYLVGGGSKLPFNASGRNFVLSYLIDTKATPVDSGDILRLLDIPANTLIRDTVANVKTAEGGTLTLDLGDYLRSNGSAVDADGFLDGFNGNAVAAVKASTETLTLTEGTPNTAAFSPAYARGKFYPTENSYLGLLFNNAADAAVIEVHVICEDCSA
jgi:hypothetical protein